MISANPSGGAPWNGISLSELILEHRDAKLPLIPSIVQCWDVTEAYNVNRRTALEAEQDAEDWWNAVCLISRNSSMRAVIQESSGHGWLDTAEPPAGKSQVSPAPCHASWIAVP